MGVSLSHAGPERSHVGEPYLAIFLMVPPVLSLQYRYLSSVVMKYGASSPETRTFGLPSLFDPEQG
jgi:hypothetical protein